MERRLGTPIGHSRQSEESSLPETAEFFDYIGKDV